MLLRRSQVRRARRTGQRAIPGGSDRRHRSLRGLALVGALAALGVIVVSSGAAKPPASEVKKYDACLQYGSLPLCSASGAHTNLPGGSSVQLQLKITNELASNQPLGSANVNAPAGLPIDTTQPVTSSIPGTIGSPTTSSQIQLRNLNLAPDSSVTVNFFVTTPCSGGPFTWQIPVKQSNNFLGTGNDFSLILAAGLISDIQPCFLNFTDCTAQADGCETDQVVVNNNTTTQAQTTSDDFVFIGIDTLDFSGGYPAGCQTFSTVGAAPMVVVDQRESVAGDVYVTYGIKKTLIQKKYGNTQGQQFIPICAGAQRIRLTSAGTTEAVPCNQPYDGNAQTGWIGKTLDAGSFDQAAEPSEAICDPDSGYFVGILGSFQDSTNSNPALVIEPSSNPTVVSWTSDTVYRYFTIRYPASSGPSGTAFDGVPWDGWQGG